MNPSQLGNFSDAFSISSSDPVTAVINVGLMGVGTVHCENETSGQVVEIDQPEGMCAWNCVSAGLVVTAGNAIKMIATGIAD